MRGRRPRRPTNGRPAQRSLGRPEVELPRAANHGRSDMLRSHPSVPSAESGLAPGARGRSRSRRSESRPRCSRPLFTVGASVRPSRGRPCSTRKAKRYMARPPAWSPEAYRSPPAAGMSYVSDWPTERFISCACQPNRQLWQVAAMAAAVVHGVHGGRMSALLSRRREPHRSPSLLSRRCKRSCQGAGVQVLV